jgi:hypothetical protein
VNLQAGEKSVFSAMEAFAKIVSDAIFPSVLLEKGRFFKVFRNLEVN